MAPIVEVSRRLVVSATHRLHAPSLSDAENEALFGKCNRKGGHGHNYVIRAVVRGPVDAATGMVVNTADLKRALAERVDAVLDHRNIDVDVPWFAEGRVSTTENVAVFVWNQLKPVVPLLHKVVVDETENNRFSYKGQDDGA